ncbi:MAG: hypothetical protein AAGG02_12080 [Cyanobacteria bacterium P01_H01_bin.15]
MKSGKPSLLKKSQLLVENATTDLYRWLTSNPPLVNAKELRIIGLRRTGNHAIAEWLKAQIEGPTEHLNNLETRCSPYRYKYEHIMFYHSEHSRWAKNHYLPLAQGQFKKLSCLICGYEDHDLQDIADLIYEQLHDVHLGKSAERYDILILRDPFNLFASRLKSNMINVKRKRYQAAHLWLQYAREFLGETNYLTHNKLCISYNRWFADQSYRQQISEYLGLTFSDEGMQTVNHLGGGSSFDGQALDGAASQMAVLDRWKSFADDPRFCQIFAENPALKHYSQKIFGEIPGTEMLFA